ncbi:unnamed protein product [Closterium sp. NIES-54]
MSADKLSPRAIPCVFLGFVPDAPRWQFYHPTSRRVFPSQDATSNEPVTSYRLFPYRSTLPPPPPLFLAPGPPPVDPLPPQGPAPSGVSQVDPLPGPAPVQVAVGSGAARGAASGGVASRGAASGGAEPGGAGSEGAETGGAEPGGDGTGGSEPMSAEPEGVEPGGAASEGAESGGVECQGDASSGGSTGASPRLSPQQLREWIVRCACLWSGAAGAGGAGGAGAGGAGVAAGARGAGGATAAGPGGAGTLSSPAVLQSVVTLRLVLSRLFALLVALLVRVLFLSPARTLWHFDLPLPSVSRLVATPVTNPSFESAAASALIAELLDFAAACRLDYATALVAESASASPPSVLGESALGTDVLEDRQEDFESLAAAVPRFASMLLAPEGDADAPDITTRTLTQRRLRGSLHEEIWLRRPPGFTESFPAGTEWSLRRPVYALRQAPCEWHDTLRTTLGALGFDPPLFLRTDTSLPPFYVHVYVDDLVFATADTETLTLVKSELQKRHTCTDVGELRSYLGLQITRDRARRTITLTQSHMVHQVLQRFGFQFSSPQLTPLSTSHLLSAPPSDESVEPSGPYPELVGCLMYLMTCTRPDLAYPLSLLARYVAPGKHRKVHWDAAKRVLRYLCSTSSMGLVLGGRGPVVLISHLDASWVDDSATQQSLQGYTFSLGSGSVSWRSTRSSLVLSSSCEAENYAGAMAAQELRWITYLLTDLGEQPCSPPVLTTLAALGFTPSTADPSLFLRTDTSLPPFYVLVYVDDHVFATADTEALTLVKSELRKIHTCTDLGELRSYLGLQITRDRARRTITMTQSHMVHQVLQRFGFQFSSPLPTPLSTGHSLSDPPSGESVEPSGRALRLEWHRLTNVVVASRCDDADVTTNLGSYIPAVSISALSIGGKAPTASKRSIFSTVAAGSAAAAWVAAAAWRGFSTIEISHTKSAGQQPRRHQQLLIPDFCQQQQQQQQYCLEQLESGCCYQNRFNSQVCVRKSRREQGRAASTCSASLLQHVGSCGSNSRINVRSSASGSTSTLSGTTGGPASSTLGYIIGITDPIGLKRKRGEAAAGAAAAEGATETQDASHEIGSTAVAASAAAAAAAAAASSAPFDLQSGGGGGCGSCGGSGGSGGGGGGGEAGGEAKREGDAEGDAGGLGVGGFDVGAESRKYPPVPLVASPPRELFRKASEDLPPTAGPWRSAAESLARAQPGGRNREDREAQKVPAHNPREFTATVTAAASAGGGGGSAGPVSSLSPRAPSLAPGDTAPLPSFAPAQYPFPHAHFPPYSFRPPSSASRASALARRSSRGGRLGGGGGVLRGKGVVGGWGSESSDDMTAAAAAASAASPVATGAGGNGGGASAGMGAGGGGERIGGGGGARAGASVGVGGSADGHNGVFVNRGEGVGGEEGKEREGAGGVGGRGEGERRRGGGGGGGGKERDGLVR